MVRIHASDGVLAPLTGIGPHKLRMIGLPGGVNYRTGDLFEITALFASSPGCRHLGPSSGAIRCEWDSCGASTPTPKIRPPETTSRYEAGESFGVNLNSFPIDDL